ncbi:unnamed protein product [Symbiodinium microadriaticum]|nr:unnamed protein product [Symbiodinium microadriaticum]
MSAQPLPTSAVNGVAPSGQDPPRRVDSQDPPTEGSALNNTSGNRAYGTSGTTASGAMGDPPSGVQTSDLGAIGVPTSGPSAEDAAAAAEQATQQQHSTILEAGGALQNGISGAGTEQGNVQMGFVTPRSRISQGDWMAALEMPRWMSRAREKFATTWWTRIYSSLSAKRTANGQANNDTFLFESTGNNLYLGMMFVNNYLEMNLWEAVRVSSKQSRAPSPDQGAPVADANVLQALTQGVRQLQELQAQALSKATSGQATEVVKPGTTALAQLPVCEGQAEAALAFQDWVEVSAIPMLDGFLRKVVSESKRLQAPTDYLQGDSLENVLKALRLWPRLTRNTFKLSWKYCTRDKEKDRDKGQELCKYFSKPSGCKRGVPGDGSPSASTVSGTPWTLEALVQAAHQVVQAQGLRDGSSSPEKTETPAAQLKVLNVKDIHVCSIGDTAAALLDSGATHCLRSARSPQEWDEAEEVLVQLAGCSSLVMRLGLTGSLLMPPKTSSKEAQTIVPMGELVKVLGYTLVWGPDRCFLEDSRGQRTPLSTASGCPQLLEAEALSMIARTEYRRREQLENQAAETQDRIALAAVAMERWWKDYLREYVATGSKDAGGRALRDAPFLQGLPAECLEGLIQDNIEPGSWRVMKEVDFLTRPERRYLWNAKRWVVHLFAGNPGHYQFFQIDDGNTVVLELDISRNRGQDILKQSTWRLLLWGALTGKIEAVVGGPPGRGGLYGDDLDTRALRSVTRMLWLYAVAKAAQVPITKYTTIWETYMWRQFQAEMGMDTVVFDQRATGAETRMPTCLATNIYYLKGLHGLGMEESDDEEPTPSSTSSKWSQGFLDALLIALEFWKKRPIEGPALRATSPEQRRAHVNSGHLDYRRDCLACVMSRGTGKRHSRVRHPDSFCLNVDVAGPVTPGLDSTSKGALGKGLKYMFVARYVLPTEFVKAYCGTQPPEDDGLKEELSAEAGVLDEEGANPCSPSSKPEDPFLERDDEPELPDLLPVDNRVREFVGSSSIQRDLLRDVDPDAFNPSEDEDDAANHGAVPFEESEAPKMTSLLFARGMKNNLASTVKAVIQDIFLYLEAHGLPVYRLHADKGETFNNSTRTWLRDRGVRATWSEAGVPQSNGGAESAVRWVKDRARSLLIGSRLPVALWPQAAEAAAAAQRSRVLGWRSALKAPFGAIVHIKERAFDSSGPRRRERAFESRWFKGHYMGLSSILEGGHVIYLPKDGEDTERFFHTCHVRPRLIDPGPPEVVLHANEPPRPRRRVAEKASPDNIEMKAAKVGDAAFLDYVEKRSKELLESWSGEEAEEFVLELASVDFFKDRKFGVFRHGGQVGWLSGSIDSPSLAQLLATMVLEVNPEATFTSIWVSKDTERGLHKDTNNDEESLNYAIPLSMPSKGGNLWIELSPGDVLRGPILERKDDRGRPRYGQVLPLEKGKCNEFSPRKAHEVLPWEGGTEDTIVGPKDETQWEMFLEVPDGEVLLGAQEPHRPEDPHDPFVAEVEVAYTRGIEKILEQLEQPLQVTYTVDPREAMECLHKWKNAIVQEVNNVESAICRLQPGSPERAAWLKRPGAQRLPTKFVFTVKPGDNPAESDRSTWFKRKARLVVCGNFAEGDDFDCYAETPPTEVLRAGLTTSRKRRWAIAILDVAGEDSYSVVDYSRTNNQFYISQKAYIEEILRAYKVGSSERDKIPLSKELADFDIQPGDLPPTPEAVAAAQEVTGKLMWALPSQRIKSLLELWGVDEPGQSSGPGGVSRVATGCITEEAASTTEVEGRNIFGDRAGNHERTAPFQATWGGDGGFDYVLGEILGRRVCRKSYYPTTTKVGFPYATKVVYAESYYLDATKVAFPYATKGIYADTYYPTAAMVALAYTTKASSENTVSEDIPKTAYRTLSAPAISAGPGFRS